MHTKLKRIAGLAVACVACAAAAAATSTNAATAAAPSAKQSAKGGTSFVASTAIGGVQLTLSQNRRSIRRGLFAYETKCSDGESFYDYDLFLAPIRINADRKFKYTDAGGPEPSTGTPGATFSYSHAISGTVNKAGTKIVGTVRSTFALQNPAGVSYTCDTGQVNFTASD